LTIEFLFFADSEVGVTKKRRDIKGNT